MNAADMETILKKVLNPILWDGIRKQKINRENKRYKEQIAL